MVTVKCNALQTELEFHKSVYDAQVNYIHCLFQALRDGYKVFEQSLQEAICQPMQGILSAYLELSREVSDDALKTFLVTFKAQYSQLVSTLEKLKVPPIPAQHEAAESQPQPRQSSCLEATSFRPSSRWKKAVLLKGSRPYSLAQTAGHN